MSDWQLLTSFQSEAEARVVESFLLAHQVEAQLLDTHSKYTHIVPTRALSGGGGLRLLVREHDLERARSLLEASERQSHLGLVTEEGDMIPGKPPPIAGRKEKIVVTALLLLFVLFSLLEMLRS